MKQFEIAIGTRHPKSAKICRWLLATTEPSESEVRFFRLYDYKVHFNSDKKTLIDTP